jgi:hypothetical protein
MRYRHCALKDLTIKHTLRSKAVRFTGSFLSNVMAPVQPTGSPRGWRRTMGSLRDWDAAPPTVRGHKPNLSLGFLSSDRQGSFPCKKLE